MMNLQGRIVFASGSATNFDIWTLDLASGSLRQLTRGEEMNDMPVWSPDGSRIAYISINSDLVAGLSIMDSDGGNSRRILENVYCQHPSWSPDGKKLLFVGNANNDSQLHLCTLDVESGAVEVVFERRGQETEPSFSPDGKKILFSSIDPDASKPFPERDTEILEYDLETKNVRTICSHPARDYSPVYSPDGSQIAFISHRNGRCEEEFTKALLEIKSRLDAKKNDSLRKVLDDLLELEQDGELYVVNSDGTNLRQLTNDSRADARVCWSPCGKFLMFSSAPHKQSNAERLKIVRADTGEAVPFDYDRSPLMYDIDANPERYLNSRWFWRLIPDSLERPIMMRALGSGFWGEERWSDWTA